MRVNIFHSPSFEKWLVRMTAPDDKCYFLDHYLDWDWDWMTEKVHFNSKEEAQKAFKAWVHKQLLGENEI